MKAYIVMDQDYNFFGVFFGETKGKAKAQAKRLFGIPKSQFTLLRTMRASSYDQYAELGKVPEEVLKADGWEEGQ